MIDDLTKLAEELGAARRAAAEVRGTAESDDGLVRAVVDGDGGLVELELDPRIYRTPDSSALAGVIKETIGDALEDAARQAFAVVRKVLPTAEQDQIPIEPVLAELRKRNGGNDSWPR
ncbi:YbaB/EbfC family DNA-binding protein [Kribbella pittospori]|uniref:YbaB/EbfC family DNA-binding protein n=1 Tax=Kribbella pittospori TaxID=722689 RepID=A0A4R0KD87_9ACTN|nr:YbaB/EbfC family nucleoid-associated protein [Kribbella pittospori]TCC58283.1 YbaB/EbfC family DNA-binding protein [Kribbella pittospori]